MPPPQDSAVRARDPATEIVPRGRLVAIEEGTSLSAPSLCACCLEVASLTVEERASAGDTVLLVNYCEGCLQHVQAVRTRRLASALGSALAGASAAASLPLVWPSSSPWLVALLAVMVALVPLLTLRVLRLRPRPGHTARGRAVWWVGPNELYATNARWAGSLTDDQPARLRAARHAEPRFAWWLGLGPVAALLLSGGLHVIQRPPLRILNLTGEPIEVRLDGAFLARVGPTSAESPEAGRMVRGLLGTHRVEVFGRGGAPVASAKVRFAAMSPHLFAPASQEYCFWLERTAYGRAELELPSTEPLQGETRFWRLPVGIDSWFSPNPEPLAADQRSSGGVLTALRQGRCADLSPKLRRQLGL